MILKAKRRVYKHSLVRCLLFKMEVSEQRLVNINGKAIGGADGLCSSLLVVLIGKRIIVKGIQSVIIYLGFAPYSIDKYWKFLIVLSEVPDNRTAS